MQLYNTESEYPFLRNGGEVGDLIKEMKWIESSLGTAAAWPESLRTSLGIMLRSNIPMFLVWGSEKILFYNDSFRPFLTGNNKHPEALGKALKEALTPGWQMVSDTIRIMIDENESRSESNIVSTVSRNDILQQVFLTIVYSPVFNQNNDTEGVFVTCIENSAVIPDVIQSGSVRSQLNNLLMQSNAGIAQANIEGRVVEVNDRYCQMLGYSREEILKMNLGELTHSDDLERNMILLKDCIENGKDFIITKRYTCRDGSQIWVNNSISLVRDAEGKKYITAIAIDMTAEKEKEEQLTASEFRFRTLIENAPVGTALFRGSEFYIELANDVMMEYWERDSAIIGKKITDVFQNTEGSEFYKALTEVYLTGKEYKVWGFEIQREKSDTEQYLDYSLTPLLDENGAVYAILVMSSDVTATIKSQQEITARQDELAAIFEQSPVGIATITIDKDLVFQSANTFYGELVGRKPNELIGKPLLEALPELKGQGFDDLLREVIRSGIAYTAKEVEVELQREGQLQNIYVDLTYQINKSASGEANSVLVVAVDVTQQVLSRREVEESETMLQNLIAGAPAGIGLFIGRDLIIEYPNQTFIDIVGKGPDIVGLPLREAMPELITEGQAYLKILDDIFTTGVPFISPASLVKIVQNGVLNNNYYNISYTPLRNKSGEIYAILDIAIDVTAQVSAQKAMEESEAHLQLLRDTVPAMIFYLDHEQRYQSYNKIFMEWFSVVENEAIGKTVREFLGEIAYENTLPHLEIAYGGEQERYEMFAPSRMGEKRWLSIVYTPHKNSDGNVIGVIVHAMDVTQSKLTEIALRESESKLRSVLAAAPVSISLFVGEDLIIENANEPFVKNVNRGDAIEGKPLVTILFEESSQKYIKAVHEVYDSGISFSASGIAGMHTTETEPHYHNISLTPLLDNNGNVYAVLHVSSDVTTEINSIKKIEQAEAALRSAVEVAQLGTWSMDVDTQITTVSERHAEMFGLTSTTLPSAKVREVIKPSDHDRVMKAFFSAQKVGSAGKYESEYRIIHGINGQEKVIHAVGQTYFDLDGKPTVISGTAQDITIHRELQLALESEVQLRTKELAVVLNELQASNIHLEQSNNALKHSNEELAQFAYVASHDLQEPLRKIRIFAGLLQEEHPSRNPKLMIEKIAFSAERMSQLISDLLSFSRLIEPEKSLHTVDLSGVIKSIWTDFELIVADKNAEITIENLPVVQAVGLQMNQLFYNLMSNSLKFTNPDRSPQIKISSVVVSHDYVGRFTDSPLIPGNYHHISFSDNGIGFEKNYENQIFEIFKRLHGQSIFPGSGIGLALCRRIVMNHKGVLYADSEFGKGSTFHIFLPDREEKKIN
ncbi:PAS domain-containing protein [Pseudomonas shirazensis]